MVRRLSTANIITYSTAVLYIVRAGPELNTNGNFLNHRVAETSHVIDLKLHTIDYIGEDNHYTKCHGSTP